MSKYYNQDGKPKKISRNGVPLGRKAGSKNKKTLLEEEKKNETKFLNTVEINQNDGSMVVSLPNKVVEHFDKFLENAQQEGLLYGDTKFLKPAWDKHYKFFKNAVNDNYYNMGDRILGEVVRAIYEKASHTKHQYIQEIKSIESFYLVDTIVDQLTLDTLRPDVNNDNEILEILYDEDNKESEPAKLVRNELRSLDEKFSFDNLVLDITPEFIKYGCYILRLKTVVGKGVVDIFDDVKQEDVIPLINYSDIIGFLEHDHCDNKVKIAEVADYCYFQYNAKKIKLDLPNLDELKCKVSEEDRELLAQIPTTIRLGRSVLWSIIDKLKELQLLEALIPSTAINNLSNSNMIGISVPPPFTPEQAKEAAMNAENLLNYKSVVNHNNSNVLSVADIISSTGNIKVIPVWGDKGNLSKLNIANNDQLTAIQKIIDSTRQMILESIGIPSELIYSSINGRMGDFLKKYARYLRMLKSIQLACCLGVKQIIYTHLINKGISFEKSKIIVQFRNNLINVDHLDELEFLDTTISMLKNLRQVIQDFEKAGYEINQNVARDYFNEQFAVVGLQNLFTRKSELEPSEKESTTVYHEADPNNRYAGTASASNDTSSSTSDETTTPESNTTIEVETNTDESTETE